MSKCVNCGRRIARDSENTQLCPRCAACETMYDAIVVKIKRQGYLVLRSFVFYMLIAAAVYYTKLFPASRIVGIALFYFAVASSMLSAAACLSQYIQLRKQRKEEEQL